MIRLRSCFEKQMRISRLELSNFRTFSHVVLENPPPFVVLVGTNGVGKSTILEAIAGTHCIVGHYDAPRYQWRSRIMIEGKDDDGTEYDVWPSHLPQPIRIGADEAQVEMQVRANEEEQTFLRSKGITGDTGSIRLTIAHGRHVIKKVVDPLAKELLRYHKPRERVGFIDYIRAIRLIHRQGVGGFGSLTDDIVRNSIAEFGRGLGDAQKFNSTKHFIVDTQLTDWSFREETGQERDSLSEFRSIFDHFFKPKRFVGIRYSGGTPASIAVQTPFGLIDIDDLSEGEKEVLHTTVHFFQLRNLENVVLWDTPEAHLNASLESRLFDSLARVAPRNQYWIATHSLEFIDSVPIEYVFAIKQNATGAYLSPANDEKQRAKLILYRELGARVGLQLISKTVVFCEGKDSHSDKSVLERLVAGQLPDVNFIAGGSCDTVLSLGSRANRLLGCAVENGDFLAIIDRDYRDDETVKNLSTQQGVFIWNCHEIENLFLDPGIVWSTLSFLGEKTLGGAEAVGNAIRDIASDLAEWIAADWLAFDFTKSLVRPSRRITHEQPFDSLIQYCNRLRDHVCDVTDMKTLSARFDDRKKQVQELSKSNAGIEKLPGKQILTGFLQKHTSLERDTFLAAAVGIIIERKIEIPEVARLAKSLQK